MRAKCDKKGVIRWQDRRFQKGINIEAHPRRTFLGVPPQDYKHTHSVSSAAHRTSQLCAFYNARTQSISPALTCHARLNACKRCLSELDERHAQGCCMTGDFSEILIINLLCKINNGYHSSGSSAQDDELLLAADIGSYSLHCYSCVKVGLWLCTIIRCLRKIGLNFSK